ncbi:MAG: hypothetical protein ACTH5M_09390 [Psychrobacter sp.]|uniref:hypothetical protein n=1 Tax=Psychrobacter sp. AOP7-B1-24 TaxID=3457645 RepID=UPI003FB9B396
MINLDEFKETIQHKDSKEGISESCNFLAYKIDDNGLSQYLGFKNGQMNQTDYFLINNEITKVQFIELTDLSNHIKECIFAETIIRSNSDSFATILGKSPKKAEKLLNSKIWSEVLGELKNKWMGSIAILERYCRREQYEQDLQYSLLIVLRDNADSRQIESLTFKLSGMMGRVSICNTKNIKHPLLLELI